MFNKPWCHKISFKELWQAFQSEEITAKELGQGVAEKLRTSEMYKFHINTLDPIISGFEDVEDIDEFDEYLEDLYDWADYDKRCWIETF